MKSNNNKSRKACLKSYSPRKKISLESKDNANKKWRKNITKISSKELTKNKMSKESWKFNNMRNKNFSKKFKIKCLKLISSKTKDSNFSIKDSLWKKKLKDKRGKCTRRFKNSNRVKSIPTSCSKAYQWKMDHVSKSLPWANLKKSKFNPALSINPSNSLPNKPNLLSMWKNQ